MKKTTEAMHRGLSMAINDLRARRGWSQEDLAKELCKEADRAGIRIKPNNVTVCRWEKMDTAPNSEARVILGRVAARHKKTAHLAEVFRAPVSAWRLAGYVALRANGESDADGASG